MIDKNIPPTVVRTVRVTKKMDDLILKECERRQMRISDILRYLLDKAINE
jgi:hypothetical protein